MDRSSDILKSLAGIQVTLLAIVLRLTNSDATVSVILGLLGLALVAAAWAGPGSLLAGRRQGGPATVEGAPSSERESQ